VNAFLAAGYISGLVFLITNYIARPNTPDDSMLIPIVMLSLFVLSAAVMGFLFAYQPFQLYMENKKQEAVSFFFTTTGVFAVITAILAATLLYFR
jgi:hypothetical protein